MIDRKEFLSMMAVFALGIHGCSEASQNNAGLSQTGAANNQALSAAEIATACEEGSLGALIGPRGIQGNDGLPGNVGPIGQTGPTGEPGSQGADGNPGQNGPIGEQGTQGARAAPFVAEGLIGGAPTSQNSILVDTPITLDATEARMLLLAGKHCPAGSELVGFDDAGDVRCGSARHRLAERAAHNTKQGVNNDLRLGDIFTKTTDFVTHSTQYDILSTMPPVPDLKVRFQSTGGPVLLQSHINADGNVDSNHFTCPLFIDGYPAAQLDNGGDVLHPWWDGLMHMRYGWQRWTSAKLYHGLAPGWHEAHVACLYSNTDLSYSDFGSNRQQTVHLSALPLSPTATTDGVRAYSQSARVGSPVGTINEAYGIVPDLSLTFESRGGPLRIAVNVPLHGGQNSSCQPRYRIADSSTVPAPLPTSLDATLSEHHFREGLVDSSAYNQWSRTRVYPGLNQGETYEISVWCATDDISTELHVGAEPDTDAGNKPKHAHLALLEYPAQQSTSTDDGSLEIYAKDHLHSGVGSTVTGDNTLAVLSNPQITISTPGDSADPYAINGNEVIEIGFSLPHTASATSFATCRPVVDVGSGFQPLRSAAALPTDELWHHGAIGVTSGSYAMMNQVRTYANLPAVGPGQDITFAIRCSGDGGATHNFHSENSVSTLFVVLMHP